MPTRPDTQATAISRKRESSNSPAFSAVPLVHFRQSMGVLVVQQRTRRVFADEEVAFLVTIGAQLAATLSYAALGSAISPHEPGPPGPVGLIQGLPGAPGWRSATLSYPPRWQSSMRWPTVHPTISRRTRQLQASRARDATGPADQRRSNGRPALRRDARDIRRLHPDPRPGGPGRRRCRTNSQRQLGASSAPRHHCRARQGVRAGGGPLPAGARRGHQRDRSPHSSAPTSRSSRRGDPTRR